MGGAILIHSCTIIAHIWEIHFRIFQETQLSFAAFTSATGSQVLVKQCSCVCMKAGHVAQLGGLQKAIHHTGDQSKLMFQVYC